MPGDFTTTSQCLSAARPLLAVANTWRPSTSPGGGRSSTSTRSTPSVRSRDRPLRGEQRGGPALADLADALERLAVGQRAQQRAELRGQGLRRVGVGQRLLAAEDGAELLGGQERGQDQVDEAALVAPAAPVVEPLGLVQVEGPVAAAERAVVLGQPGEPQRDPQLAERAQEREVADP